jgi:hypothetical protein
MRAPPSRRDLLLMAGFGWTWPNHWFHRHVRFGDIAFREYRRGEDRRRYIWLHGDERTAHDVLRDHLRRTEGRAFLVENDARNVRFEEGLLDPNRVFSRAGAERNLRSLNPGWSEMQLEEVLRRLDMEREPFLSRILPASLEGLLVALHNNSASYSVQDEAPISDAVAMNDPPHPDEFLLCTIPGDFERLSMGAYNVVLQHSAPTDDDGSLSRLCAARGVRYVNIEAAHGNATGQQEMLNQVERVL